MAGQVLLSLLPDRNEAHRVLLPLLVRHHPQVTLEERLRQVDMLAVKFLKTAEGLPGFELGPERPGAKFGMTFTTLSAYPADEILIKLTGVGDVRMRINKQTAAIEMAPGRSPEWKEAAVELDWVEGEIVGKEFDPDRVPVRGRRMPRKDALQVLAELFAELLESPAARAP